MLTSNLPINKNKTKTKRINNLNQNKKQITNNMETKIYKSYEDFVNREDKRENGVSEGFAAKHPDFEEQNKTNTGCWNCYDCKNCDSCNWCHSCDHCHSCYHCDHCDSCDHCISCNWCHSCHFCDLCNSCNSCDHREGVINKK